MAVKVTVKGTALRERKVIGDHICEIQKSCGEASKACNNEHTRNQGWVGSIFGAYILYNPEQGVTAEPEIKC